MTGKGPGNVTENIARVLIVDDHPAICEGLGHRISAQPDLSVCGQAADVDEALAMIRQTRPDVVIVDVRLKTGDGLELIKAIQANFRGVRALAHSMYEESLYADRCLHAGAMGYVNKGAHPDEVIKAIREILAGHVYLSPTMTNAILRRTVNRTDATSDPVETLTDRQMEIFRLVGEGLSTRNIANRLHISVHTVETHRENIKRKLELQTVGELTHRAVLWIGSQG